MRKIEGVNINYYMHNPDSVVENVIECNSVIEENTVAGKTHLNINKWDVQKHGKRKETVTDDSHGLTPVVWCGSTLLLWGW